VGLLALEDPDEDVRECARSILDNRLNDTRRQTSSPTRARNCKGCGSAMMTAVNAADLNALARELHCREVLLRCEHESFETVYVSTCEDTFLVSDQGHTSYFLSKHGQSIYDNPRRERVEAICARNAVEFVDLEPDPEVFRSDIQTTVVHWQDVAMAIAQIAATIEEIAAVWPVS